MQSVAQLFKLTCFLFFTCLFIVSGCAPKRHFQPPQPKLSSLTKDGEKSEKDNKLDADLSTTAEAREFILKSRSEHETKPEPVAPVVAPRQPPMTSGLQILEDPRLIVNHAKSLMLLKIHFKLDGEEQRLELEGNYNDSNIGVKKAYLYPKDAQIKLQRKYQATALCLGDGECQLLGLEFFATDRQNQIQKVYYESQVPKDLFAPVKEDDLQDTFPPIHTEPNIPEETDDSPISIEAGSEGGVDPDQDPNQVRGPIQLPQPDVDSPYSIPGLPPTKPLPPHYKLLRDQAIGYHNGGKLVNGTQLPRQGQGYISVEKWGVWGTDQTVENIQRLSEIVATEFPGRPSLMINDISKKGGRKFGEHKSHQTGLDVDIYYPALKSSNETTYSVYLNGRTGENFDIERFWFMARTLTCHPDFDGQLMTIFINYRMRPQLCHYVRSQASARSSSANYNADNWNLADPNSCATRTMRYLYEARIKKTGAIDTSDNSHRDHLHVRFYCPGNSGCSNKGPAPRPDHGCPNI